MPNQLVRDQWEYLTKMERRLPIKPDQPMGMALIIFYSLSGFPNKGKELVCQKWNSESVRIFQLK